MGHGHGAVAPFDFHISIALEGLALLLELDGDFFDDLLVLRVGRNKEVRQHVEVVKEALPVASRGAERHADGEVGFVGVLFSVCFHFGAVRDGVERHDLLQLENTAGKQGGLMLVAASEQFNFVGCAVEAVVDVAGNPLVVIDEVRLVHARCSEGEAECG